MLKVSSVLEFHGHNVTQIKSGLFFADIFHFCVQGSENLSVNLTAYVTVALQEILDSSILSNDTEEKVRKSISCAQSYLEENLDVISDNAFSTSLVTFALSRTGSNRSLIFKQALDRLAINKDGRRYWTSQNRAEHELDSDKNLKAVSDDILMTAYALHTYLSMEDLPMAASIAKWLLEKRTVIGGFISTQDSVVAIEALSAYAVQVYAADPQMDLTVTISSDATYSYGIKINTENTALLQQIELPTQSGEVTVNGWGKGTCVMTLTVFYNSHEVKTEEAFLFEVIFEDNNETDTQGMKAYGRFIGKKDATNMCVMDIGIPSGFAADVDDLKKVQDTNSLVKRIETDGQSIYFYFEEIPKDNMTSVEFSVTRSNLVKNFQPSYAKLYDYYNPAERMVVSYLGEKRKESDVPGCEGCTVDGSRPLISLLQSTVLPVLATACILM